MSTFSGLGTALSSLIAQRQGLEVSGQNVANANTVGYTRQRATLSALPASSVPSMFATSTGVGQGVFTSGFERMGDIFIDARLRTETSGAAYLKQLSASYIQLEDAVGEPGDTGLSSQLSQMWAAWSEASKSTDGSAARSVLLERSADVATRIGSLYTGAQTQWSQTRTTTQSLVTQVNTTAANLADLNGRILSITNAGGSANELMDARDLLITQLSGLVGASARIQENGTVDVMVAGNALVNGSESATLEVSGASSFEQAMAGESVTVVWSKNGASAGLDGGRVAGLLTVMAPPNTDGSGGLLTEAATGYNALAAQIATQVNALHSTAYTEAGYASGTTAGDFFTLAAGKPAALGLTVAITDPKNVGLAAAGAGELDGSIGEKLAALATASNGPDATWSAQVVQLGVRAASAGSRASVAEAARATSEAQQLAQTSVDTDEESITMLAYQRAYEGAARVLTAIDEMLDTLINRTGVVGR
ncbi:flagellar hook-associated protein FlgK [Cellulomonas sp. NPDC089187]|uniref:flagellar hook-associated protein FlgK n=1 Tax=Cellulomonas sp. NPDC089187 TaxID=3154970 RepID=UPI0034379E48